jgi:redox-sensitive bicupin YhaK (pirin superfamily)
MIRKLEREFEMNIETVDREFCLSQPLSAHPLEIGDHFFAHSFHHREFGAQMNPLLMFDHFWMKRDTFGWHPHQGFSAVTYLFEDSKSTHHNSDSMGNNVPIHPGSLHWLVAGSGAMHRERPEEEDALVHGLQFFVDLPDQSKMTAPYAQHLDSENVPEVMQDGSRIRIVAGEFKGTISPIVLPQPFSLYDVHMRENSVLHIPLPANWGTWLYVVSGAAVVGIEGDSRALGQFQAVRLQTVGKGQIVTIQSDRPTQIVVLAGEVKRP